MWVQLCEPNNVAEPSESDGWSGLLFVEQRPKPALLQLQLLQSRSAGEPEKRMEESQCNSDCGSRSTDMGLSYSLQCLQKCPNWRPLPQIQTGLDLNGFSVLWFCQYLFLILSNYKKEVSLLPVLIYLYSLVPIYVEWMERLFRFEF